MYRLLQGFIFEAVFLGNLCKISCAFPKRKFCRAGLSAISFALQKDAALSLLQAFLRFTIFPSDISNNVLERAECEALYFCVP